MKTRKTKRSSAKTSDLFAFFQQTILDAFRYLGSDFAFELISTSVHLPECAIIYQNDKTGVTVSYEWESEVWVALSRLDRYEGEVVDVERYGLEVLIEERCPDCKVNKNLAEGNWTNDNLERIVREYASTLRQCGSEVLLGDFEVFPRLKLLTERRTRERNLKLYGSETGETPPH